MRTHRFYTHTELNENTCAELAAEAAHHCIQVLRYKVGDKLTVFNGDGFDYLANIAQIEKKRCLINITQKIALSNESPINIHLVQGIARGDKMDFIIQKAVEMGVSQITPLLTERCNVKLNEKRLEKKQQHWQKIIIGACEQSGRSNIPKINPLISINQLKKSPHTMVLLQPTAKKSFKDLAIEHSIKILIGSEGGFSENDLKQLKSIDAQGVTLGPRILRTETAGLCAISIIQSLFGDM